jgi:hypothetical protein
MAPWQISFRIHLDQVCETWHKIRYENRHVFNCFLSKSFTSENIEFFQLILRMINGWLKQKSVDNFLLIWKKIPVKISLEIFE